MQEEVSQNHAPRWFPVLVAFSSLDRPDALQQDSICFSNAGGAVGRVAVLLARRPVGRHAQYQHVHADRHGGRRRLPLERDRNARPW